MQEGGSAHFHQGLNWLLRIGNEILIKPGQWLNSFGRKANEATQRT
jgi:hypothetical protein